MNPLAPYLMWIKLGAVAVLAVAIGVFAWRVHAWRDGYLSKAATEAQAQRDKATYLATLQSYKDAQAKSQAASSQYQAELHEIRNRPVATGPVRLCVAAASVPRKATAPSGPRPAVPASGVLPATTGSDLAEGPDISADLYRLADEADEVSAKGRAVQGLK